MNEINVEKIMEEIRENIKKQGFTEEQLNFEEIKESVSFDGVFDESRMKDELRLANQFAGLNYAGPVEGTGIKRFIKRVIRKLLRFYVHPVFERQNEFNAHNVRTLNELGLYVTECEKKQKELEEALVELRKTVETLQGRG